VLTGLSFPREYWDRPLAGLSGGERTRAHLAGLLLRDPDVLLLDEPTNHLDMDAVEWLESWLGSFRGALLAVSHDRYFLDRATTATWEVDGGGVEVYRGAYSHYRRQRTERREERRRVWAEQQEYIQRTQDFIARHIAGQRTREARGRRAHLEKFLREEAVERPPEDEVMALCLPEPERCGDLALRAEGLAAGYDRPLVQAESIEVLRGEKVAIVGPNGSGKTTLLRTLLGQLPPLAGALRPGAGLRVGYLSQNHAELDPDRTALDLVLESSPPGTRPERVRGLLGSLGLTGDDAFKRPGQLSGGQRSRVLLARLVMSRANLLALDEPTNHLDLPSAEIIQQALCSYEGTVLFVSHDRYLVQRVATRVWVVSEGGVHRLPGGWDAYLAWRAERSGRSGCAAATERPAGGQAAFRAARRLANRQASLRRQMESVEERIDAAEKQLAALNEAITAAGQAGDTARVAELGRGYQELDRELAGLCARWEELGEELGDPAPA
jgi:ATP-binding cassette subfamily F protein 3